jgi:hypothetical protein
VLDAGAKATRTITLASIITLALASALSAQTVISKGGTYRNENLTQVTIVAHEKVVFEKCTFFIPAQVVIDTDVEVEFKNCVAYGQGGQEPFVYSELTPEVSFSKCEIYGFPVLVGSAGIDYQN